MASSGCLCVQIVKVVVVAKGLYEVVGKICVCKLSIEAEILNLNFEN